MVQLPLKASKTHIPLFYWKNTWSVPRHLNHSTTNCLSFTLLIMVRQKASQNEYTKKQGIELYW